MASWQGPKPSIDVVVSTFNEERYVERCLDHLMRQDYPAELVDIWLIDGGSTDGTVERIRRRVDGNRRMVVATRTNVADPFHEPKRIDSCATGKWEVSPALSPDGLQLLFVRPYVKGHFFYTRRASTSDEFGEPIPWPEPGLDPTKKRVGHPRFHGPLRLIFNVVDLASGTPTFLMAKRDTPGTVFESPQEVGLTNFGAWACLSEDGLHCYSGSPKGLTLASRESVSDPFGPKVRIVDAELTGPIDVPVWVTPQEDVIFYCSPGPGEELGSARKLWMVRF